LSEKIELSKIRRQKQEHKASDDSKVYDIEVIGQLPPETNIIILGGKK
jgi:hypothetical protein